LLCGMRTAAILEQAAAGAPAAADKRSTRGQNLPSATRTPGARCKGSLCCHPLRSGVSPLQSIYALPAFGGIKKDTRKVASQTHSFLYRHQAQGRTRHGQGSGVSDRPRPRTHAPLCSAPRCTQGACVTMVQTLTPPHHAPARSIFLWSSPSPLIPLFTTATHSPFVVMHASIIEVWGGEGVDTPYRTPARRKKGDRTCVPAYT